MTIFRPFLFGEAISLWFVWFHHETISCCPAGDSVPDWSHILLFFCIGAKCVRLYIEGCRHVIVHPRGLLFILVFLQQTEMSHNFAFQCSCWISAETGGRMETEVILFITSLYYNVCTVCWIKD